MSAPQRGRKRDFERAIGDCTAALAKEPKNASHLRRRGEAKRKLGQVKEALSDFDAALGIAPQYAQALAGRGACKRALGQVEEAITDFNAALALEPENALTLLGRCASLRALGRNYDALKDVDSAITLEPRNAPALQLRGELRRKLGMHKEAIEDFNVALEMEPQNVAALAGRGSAQRALGRLTGALSDLDVAYKLEPQNAAVLTGRGTAKLELGRCQEALADFKTALKISPNDAFAKWGSNQAARQGLIPPRKLSLRGFQVACVNKQYVERRQPEFLVNDRETFWSVDGDAFLYWCNKENRWKGSRAVDLRRIQGGASCAFFGAPVGTDILDEDFIKGWHEWDGKAWSQRPAAGVANLAEGAPARSVTLAGFRGGTLNARYLEVRHPKFTIAGKETYWSEDRAYFLFWCKVEKRWKGSRAADFAGNRGGASKAIIAAPASMDVLSPSLLKGWHEWDGKGWALLKEGGVATLGVVHV